MSKRPERDVVNYLFGDLEGREKAELGAMIDGVPEARDLRDDYHRLEEKIRRLPEPDPNPFLGRRIMAQVRRLDVERQQPRSPSVKRLYVQLIPLFAMAVAAVVLFALVLPTLRRDSVGRQPAVAVQTLRDESTTASNGESLHHSPDQLMRDAVDAIRKEQYSGAKQLLTELVDQHPEFPRHDEAVEQLVKVNVFLGDFSAAGKLVEKYLVSDYATKTNRMQKESIDSSDMIPASSELQK